MSQNLLTGLVGAWCPSLGPSGYTLLDRSGRGNHGTLTNMTAEDWVASPGGWALDFDGSNDHVIIQETPSLNPANAITLFAWIFFTGGGNRQIWGKASGTGASDRQYGLYVNNGNALGFEIRTTSGSVDTGKGIIVASRWTPVAGTFNGATMTWYINGRSQGTESLAGTITPQVSTITLGQFPGGFSPFSGRMDSAAIWSRALTAPEIWLLASGGRTMLGTILTQRRRNYALKAASANRTYLFLAQSQIIGGGTL